MNLCALINVTGRALPAKMAKWSIEYEQQQQQEEQQQEQSECIKLHAEVKVQCSFVLHKWLGQ